MRRGTGGDQAALQILMDLLISKGVPEANAKDRAQQAIKRIGLPQIQAALKQPDQWRALKETGSRLSKPFQFVLYSELQSFLNERAGQKHGADHKAQKKGKKPKQPAAPIVLEPDQLELLPDTFVDPDGDVVQMLEYKELVSNARGISVVSHAQALQLTSDDTNLSTDALAILTIGDISSSVSHRVSAAIQWPAVYRPNREPVLIAGTLIQLGDIHVDKRAHADAPEVAAFPTVVLRVQVFADNYDGDWQQFHDGPLKMIINTHESLQFCDQACIEGCPRFHPPVEEQMTTVVLDAWGRKWLTTEGRPCKVGHATMFSMYIRIPSSAMIDVLRASGWMSTFFEPRASVVSQGSHPDFAVVWLPKKTSLEDAFSHKRKNECVIGLARIGEKLGLRVKTAHEATLMKAIYPECPAWKVQITTTYEVGPLPFGLTRQALFKLLQAWAWKARPLRPVRSTSQGKYWEIGADCEPPSPLLYTDQGEVTVTPIKDNKPFKDEPAVVGASQRTKALLRRQPAEPDSRGVDLWQKGPDPWSSSLWSNYKPVSGRAQAVLDGNKAAPAQPAKLRVEKLQADFRQEVDQIRQGMKAKEQEATSSSKVADTKMQTELRELQAQSKKSEGLFNEVGVKMNSMDSQMQHQGQQIQELSHAVQNQVQVSHSIQQDVGQMRATFSEQLRDIMDQQTTRLEAMLEKRAKTG